jgi:UDP-N-acetylmuramate dehydrogenase
MQVLHNVALAPYTSLRVGGPAENLLELTDNDDLAVVVNQQPQPIWVLGGGTNCLVSDKGLPGTVVLNQVGKIRQLGPTRLQADSGVVWDNLVKKAIELDLYGLEFCSGIPGSVGAAVVGNIAAYGQSISDRLIEATLLDTSDNSVSTWQNQDFGFAYRTSQLQKLENKALVVLTATFELSPTPLGDLEYDSAKKIAQTLGLEADTLAHRREIIMETRKRAGSLLEDKQTGPWTAGSFFKNPVVNEEQARAIIAHDETGISIEQLLHQNKIHSGVSGRVSAAHVLLAAGFSRGQTWGQVRLHPDHILKLENVGQASAQDIYNVVQQIIKTVRQKLGITLEPEVRFLGEFLNS